MKKFLAIVMCLAMALSMMTVVSFAADTPTFGVSDVTVKEGTETATVNVYIENNPGITALGLGIGYPTEISVASQGEYLDLFDGGSATCPKKLTGNPYKVNWSDDFDDYNTNGDMFAITFNVADAKPGVYPITVYYADDDSENVYNADGDYFDFAFVNGSITVEADDPVVTDPEATIVDVPVEPTAEGGVVTVFQVAGNATEFGVTYDGVDYPSAAEAADLANYFAFAVELIGADGEITAYAK